MKENNSATLRWKRVPGTWIEARPNSEIKFGWEIRIKGHWVKKRTIRPGWTVGGYQQPTETLTVYDEIGDRDTDSIVKLDQPRVRYRDDYGNNKILMLKQIIEAL